MTIPSARKPITSRKFTANSGRLFFTHLKYSIPIIESAIRNEDRLGSGRRDEELQHEHDRIDDQHDQEEAFALCQQVDLVGDRRHYVTLAENIFDRRRQSDENDRRQSSGQTLQKALEYRFGGGCAEDPGEQSEDQEVGDEDDYGVASERLDRGAYRNQNKTDA